MLRRAGHFLFSTAGEVKGRTAFLLLSLLAIFIRLPFFFRDYIDRDESTFILMGQSLIDGHLPYTELWDLKPPLVFFFFAGLIYVFGKSLIAIRLAGALVVAVTAFFTFAIGKRLHSSQFGIWAGVGCVLLLSLFGSLQGVMSEHLSMLYFMPGLYLLTRYRSAGWAFASGLLMGLAMMNKINLAYAVLLLGLFQVYEAYRLKKLSGGIVRAGLFGAGIILVAGLTCLPYYVQGQTDLWWNSVILAPLEYTEARRYPIYKMAPMLVLVGIFFFVSFKRKWLQIKDPDVQLLSLAVIGVLLSFVKGGRINGHYLIQFHPIFIILLGVVLIRALPPISVKWRPLLLLLLLVPAETYKEYISVARHRIERGTYFNGEGFSVPAYLIEKKLPFSDILFLEYHIGYWLLESKPPTRAATHPSNLCRDELFKFYGNPRKNSMEELRYIMEELRPALVISRHKRRIFDRKEEEENLYMTNYLQQNYRVVALVDGAEIHHRL